MYLAKTKDGVAEVFLSRDSQMEKYLAVNCDIYFRESEGSEDVLIATPEQGFLVERPTFPAPESNNS